MEIFTKMLCDGMKAKGHTIKVWYPNALVSRIPAGNLIVKWLQYIDQYLLFPIQLTFLIQSCKKNTLFVFTDQALGPWIPLFRYKKHVIHCHDFLALQSALGEIPENPTSWTGKKYQILIKRGFSLGKNFISVSENTKIQLSQILKNRLIKNERVYNGVSSKFKPIDSRIAREIIQKELTIDLSQGYILHIGGNQWYKNRAGVIEIYNAWRSVSIRFLPLILIGEKPSETLKRISNSSKYSDSIYYLTDKDNEFIKYAYAGASLLLFPSLAEGYGWPIAEAMACGCPVITTNEAPMTEVGGEAAVYIEKRPNKSADTETWAQRAALVMQQVISSSNAERKRYIEKGFLNIERFNEAKTLEQIERIYQSIVDPIEK